MYFSGKHFGLVNWTNININGFIVFVLTSLRKNIKNSSQHGKTSISIPNVCDEGTNSTLLHDMDFTIPVLCEG
jgi:hypothetical protein